MGKLNVDQQFLHADGFICMLMDVIVPKKLEYA